MNKYVILFSITLIINIFAFFIMKYDKYLAKNNKRRISEKTLFTTALFLGGIGIYAGMYTFRHKTKHNKFIFGIPIIIILNFICIYYIITKII